jgi:hypothetical protein
MRLFAIVGLIGVLAGCGASTDTAGKKKLTERQRDSVLAETKLPGAAGVGHAITAADSAEARAKRLDELAQ